MSETKWTPGPWQAHSLLVAEAGKSISRGHDICHCGLGMRPNQDIYQSVANAQLIAAAPELYEALKALDALRGPFPPSDEEIANAWLLTDTALAKATGEA